MQRSTRSIHTIAPYATLGAASLALALFAGTLVAGPLNPPAGAVQSTMKTLTEVEPRIAINSGNTPGDAISLFKITQAGSYYLTGNITGSVNRDAAILIAADGVTLDLGGFQIISNGSQFGISVGAVRGVSIRNGSIINAGTNGIGTSGSSGTNLRDLRVFNAGESSISAGTAAIVENCTVSQTGSNGIVVDAGSAVRGCSVSGAGGEAFIATKSVIDGCTAINAGGIGFSVGSNSSVTNCSASNCTSGFQAVEQARFINCGAINSSDVGILSGFNSIVENCTAQKGQANGIQANDGAVVRACIATANQGCGIAVDSRCIISANTSNGNGPSPSLVRAGIYVAGTDSRIEANSIIGNDIGIQVLANGNMIVRNTASGNSSINYYSVTGNVWGPVIAATTTGAFNANTGFGGTGTTDANANFSY